MSSIYKNEEDDKRSPPFSLNEIREIVKNWSRFTNFTTSGNKRNRKIAIKVKKNGIFGVFGGIIFSGSMML